MLNFRFLNPEIFQGSIQNKNYFEGWYYKVITRDEKTLLSVIPGISTAKGDGHSFIQVIQPHPGRTAYVRYPLESFTASKRHLTIGIRDNSFTERGMALNIQSPEASLKGALEFTDIIPFPKSVFRRGIMGPFGYVPFMECYHGIVSIHHRVNGILEIDGSKIDFGGGTGYIEKDWGRSFPSAWIWFQSYFADSNTTVMFSVADIPFMKSRFCGILAFLYFGGKYYSIATYNGAKIKAYSLDGHGFSIRLQNRKYELYLKADYTESGLLKAPVKGLMQRDIGETLNARSFTAFRAIGGETLFQGQNEHTGLEICGDVQNVFGRAKPPLS